jgi:multiple sugar transport system substrate-binding protein
MRHLASQAVLMYQEPESLAAFVRGNAVFHRNWPYAWDVSNDPTRSIIVGKVGVAPLPRFSGGRSVSALGGWLYGLSAYSEHPEQAWQFISFLSGYDMQKYFAIHAGIAPSRISLYADPAVLKAHPFYRDQFRVFQGTTPRPRSPLYPAISHILQRYFSRALAFPADSDLHLEALGADRQINLLLDVTAGH